MWEFIPVTCGVKRDERKRKDHLLRTEAGEGSTSAFKDLKGSEQCTLVISPCKISSDKREWGEVEGIDSDDVVQCNALQC